MKAFLKRTVALLLATCISGSLLVTDTEARSLLLTQRPTTYGTVNNGITYFNDSMVQGALDDIQSYWSGKYPNHEMVAHHSRVYSERVTESAGVYTYRFYVEVDGASTLSVAPESHPYLQGMKKALTGMNSAEYAHAVKKVTEYEETLAFSYGMARDFTALYTFVYEFPYDFRNGVEEVPVPSVYAGTAFQNWKTKLPDVSGYATGYARYQEQVSAGESALWQYLWEVQALGAPTRSVTYSIDKAVAYAYGHAWDTPQYSAANGLGSDCANFVSYCLLNGGITEDRSGAWYPSSSWGSYGGGNWIRTGYTASVGGVVLYMRNRNLFYKVSNPIVVSSGSILFYQDSSHVGLVTYHDGEIMTHADHSNYAKEHRDYLYEVRNADYYGPSPYILVD